MDPVSWRWKILLGLGLVNRKESALTTWENSLLHGNGRSGISWFAVVGYQDHHLARRSAGDSATWAAESMKVGWNACAMLLAGKKPRRQEWICPLFLSTSFPWLILSCSHISSLILIKSSLCLKQCSVSSALLCLCPDLSCSMTLSTILVILSLSYHLTEAWVHLWG